jgi:hypothetical protein
MAIPSVTNLSLCAVVNPFFGGMSESAELRYIFLKVLTTHAAGSGVNLMKPSPNVHPPPAM